MLCALAVSQAVGQHRMRRLNNGVRTAVHLSDLRCGKLTKNAKHLEELHRLLPYSYCANILTHWQLTHCDNRTIVGPGRWRGGGWGEIWGPLAVVPYMCHTWLKFVKHLHRLLPYSAIQTFSLS